MCSAKITFLLTYNLQISPVYIEKRASSKVLVDDVSFQMESN